MVSSRAHREAASYDSSSLNRRSISLNAQSWKEKWSSEEEIHPDPRARNTVRSVKRVMTIYTGEMSREQRRQLRKRLRHELNKVRGLTSKIEARELQVRRQSQSTGIYPSMSDAQFSVNDVRSAGGKEVTSQLQHDITNEPELSRNEYMPKSSHFPLASPTYSSHLLRAQSFGETGGTRTETELSHNKRTTKANQMHTSEAVGGKEKTPPAVNSRVKPGGGNKRFATAVDGRLQKSNPVGAPVKKSPEFVSQCKAILKKLMSHKDGWVFNDPVDALTLGLHDYHTIIKKPMDLGTIKLRLERKEYTSPQQFANDVRLTFRNAMTYNPPGNDVHEMAVVLQRLFEDNWKVFSQKLEMKEAGGRQAEVLTYSSGQPSTIAAPATFQAEDLGNPTQPKGPAKPKTVNGSTSVAKPKAPAKPKTLDANPTVSKPKGSAKPKTPGKPVPAPKQRNTVDAPKLQSKPKREMSYEEKANVFGRLHLLPAQMQEGMIQLIKERNPNMCEKDDELEIDLEAFDNDALWELDEYINNCLKSLEKSTTTSDQKGQPSIKKGTLKPPPQEQGQHQEEEEDVNIMDDNPKLDDPVATHNDTNNGNRPSSSSSSSSESGSSSDSDSESSSGSESDGS